jgi:hypothetical protein
LSFVVDIKQSKREDMNTSNNDHVSYYCRWVLDSFRGLLLSSWMEYPSRGVAANCEF